MHIMDSDILYRTYQRLVRIRIRLRREKDLLPGPVLDSLRPWRESVVGHFDPAVHGAVRGDGWYADGIVSTR
jgi:hypothetical protein